MKDTSLMAYAQIYPAHTQRGKVFRTIKKGPKSGLTRQEISKKSGVPINAVCGRVNELIQRGSVIEGDRRACRVTGIQAHPLFPEDYFHHPERY